MLEVENFTKYYGEHLAVEDLSFKIEDGEFGTLLGPSGCGKSTTLHTIAGLIEPTEGTVLLRGEDVTHQSPDERNIGLVFQNSATFPHMTVGQNIAYGLKMHDFDPDEVGDRISSYLDLVQMSEHRDKKPTQLSGGQERRVSIARALAYEPDILLLDEPLTGLDRVLRQELRNEIRTIQREVEVTTLYVTHDQEEALSMSDRIIVLNDGRKQQEGTPREIYDNPRNRFIADFIGKSTKIHGAVASQPNPSIETEIGAIHVDRDTLAPFDTGQNVIAYVRPEHIQLSNGDTTDANTIEGVVSNVEYLGTYMELEVDIGEGIEAIVHTNTSHNVSRGDELTLTFDPADITVLEA